jgi:signal transduction histidine kinase
MPKATIETLNVQYILLSSIALFEDIENLNIEFKNEITKEVFVLADKEQLLRVFNNLLKNAIQAIPENKKGEIKVALQESNKNIIIRIADNGSGINAAVIDKIFVPNFTTKTGGMGLGLAIVKNIVDGIGGTIWFETVKEKGSIFYVSLPCIS